MDTTLKPGDAVKVRGFSGVACRVIGPQTEPGPTEFTCYECNGNMSHGSSSVPPCDVCEGNGYLYDDDPEPTETGKLLVVMIGDDHKYAVDPEDCELIDEDEESICSCGQLGCGWG